MNGQPLDPVADRGRDGKFLPGNRAAKGNPFARKVAALRSSMIRAVGREDIKAVVQKLIELARAGDVPAARLVLSYAIGRPPEIDPEETTDPKNVSVQVKIDGDWYGNQNRLAAIQRTELRPTGGARE